MDTVNYLLTRPMGTTKLKMTPVYSEKMWKNLVLLRLRSLTLGVLLSLTTTVSCWKSGEQSTKILGRGKQGVETKIRERDRKKERERERERENENARASLTSACFTKYEEISKMLDDFEERLQETAVQLPVEEPPVLLRHFTGQDTVAFVFTHNRSRFTIAPSPRPGPASEARKAMQTFHWFYSRASTVTAQAAISNLLLSHDGYSFHSKMEDDFNLHVLYADTVKMDDVEMLSNEIITNARRRLEDVVRD